MGIRTPWTLESPTVWARTHPVGGMAFCAAGLLIAALALVVPAPWPSRVLVGLLVGAALFNMGYSYVAFCHKKRLREAA